MSTKKARTSNDEMTSIQLSKGDFTPTEASHVISNLISEKINFYKIQGLQNWEGNHASKNETSTRRIEELEMALEKSKSMIQLARELGLDLKINGLLEISLVQK